MPGDISLIDLLDLCTRCARAASEIIHSIHSTNQDHRLSMEVIEKGVDNGVSDGREGRHDPPNFQTAADRITEYHILKELRYAFPNVTVIGEEESESIGNVEEDHRITYEWILRDVEIPSCMRNLEIRDHMRLNSRDVMIWVDPLDGTFGFSQGHLGCVTTMIGISYNGVPVAGVISRPLCGNTFVGLMDCGLFYLPKDSRKMIVLRRQPDIIADHSQLIMQSSAQDLDVPPTVKPVMNPLLPSPTQNPVRLITSKNRCSKFVADCIRELSLRSEFNVDIVRCAGAGMKFLLLLLGYVDFYVYPRAGLRKWDVCAGAALLKSVGGLVTNERGHVIRFDLEGGTYSNNTNTIISGIVASNSSARSLVTVSLPGISNCVNISPTGPLFSQSTIDGQDTNDTLMNQLCNEREEKHLLICDHSIIVKTIGACTEINKIVEHDK